MIRSRFNPARMQRGWSLVEAAVVAVLVGVMATGLWKTLDFAKQRDHTEQSRDQMQRAEDALQAWWGTRGRLPPPDGARSSPGRPSHLEGWLPQHVLATARPRQFWYVVDTTLTAAPTAVFNPDPMNLLGEAISASGPLSGRLNQCLSLVNRERSGTVASQGMRVAFALQQTEPDDEVIAEGTHKGQLVKGLRLGAQQAGAQASGSKGRVRAVGYAETLHRFDCFAAFAAVAAEVKSAALFNDLSLLAEQEVKFRELGVKATEESIMNHQWRITNVTILLATDSWSLVNAVLSITTTPPGMAMGGLLVVGYVAQLAARIMSLKFSMDSLERNQKGLPGAEQAVVNAMGFQSRLDEARTKRLDRLQSLLK